MNSVPAEFTVTISMQTLDAALRCISASDVRPLCNSIHFIDGVCVAADGCMLLIQSGLNFKGRFSMSPDLVKWILKAKKKFASVDVTVNKATEPKDYEHDRLTVTLGDGETRSELTFDTSLSAQNALAAYSPEITPLPASRTALASDYLERAGRIGKILERPIAYVHTQGRRATVIRLCKGHKEETTDVHLVVMPQRVDWFFEQPAPALKKAA